MAGLATIAATSAWAAINPGTPWPATDALGRSVQVENRTPGGTLRPNRTVGIFYFIWHDERGTAKPYDIADILARDPDILQKPDSPLWGPKGTMYYWGQPLYGYYHPMDPWVLRRHATLLADAGVDTIIIDATNRRTYHDVYMRLCEVWSQVRRDGGRTPQICFMVNTKAGETAQELYDQFYSPGHFPELWFQWQGKPLLICDPAQINPAIRDFFTLRAAHWPFTMVNTQNAWHWESTYPQVYSYETDPAKPEQVNVAVAQNLRISDGKVNNMSDGDSRGRSFHGGRKDPAVDAVNYGYNFAEQFQRARELDPPFVMVTGWNEWIAGRFSRPNKPVVFVDQFNQEYSRDIEPVTGLHGDNYYYQLVDNVRRYKGQVGLPRASGTKTIDLGASFQQWDDVSPGFTDPAFDAGHREYGAGARHYVNTSGRNDLVVLKVARDERMVYFYARTREKMLVTAEGRWMWLLLDTDQNHATGWEGYDWIINRSVEGGDTWLERNTGGWNWEKVAKLKVTVSGNELMLAIPRASLGLNDAQKLAFDFKWWDQAPTSGVIMETYVTGDCAPDARFNFRYESGFDSSSKTTR